MRIALVEPYFSGSHKSWATELQRHSSYSIELFTLPGRNWKWRMHGAAISLAKKVNEIETAFDLIVVTDMMDLSVFKSLLSPVHNLTPIALYFHENQLTYPWSNRDPDAKDEKAGHYQFINYSSALVADRVYFNSAYHMNSFLDALKPFISTFPDHKNMSTIAQIEKKSSVLPIGIDLKKFDEFEAKEWEPNEVPIILWNHRWEYDKNPDDFFQCLFDIKEQGYSFQLVVLGAHFRTHPKIFTKAKEVLSNELLHIGFCESFEEYARWLWKSDILPVTSIQDFFGISIIEAIYCKCLPILPNRLAYPEHITTKDLFYDSYSELLSILKDKIESNISSEKVDNRNAVLHYDWEVTIREYDQKWRELVEKHLKK
ncbi:tRNA-queuosine alpha-mannosyltransferase domain-containing protein [Halocola ammonii]